MNIGRPRFKLLRLMQYWHGINSIILIILLLREGWNWWFVLFVIPAVLIAKKLSDLDSNKTIQEEQEFLFQRHPLNDVLKRIEKNRHIDKILSW